MVRNKGHSKWQNIKHTKTTKDHQRGQKIGRFMTQLRSAVINGGGSIDPKVNVRLADVIAAAKKEEVPMSTIERNLKKMTERISKPITIELIGPGGVYIILDGETENIGVTMRALKDAIRPFKGCVNIARTGALVTNFTERGVVRISRKNKNGEKISFEEAESIAIEAGAEEINSEQDSEDSSCKDNEINENDETWDLMCDKNDFYHVKDFIEKNRPDLEITEYCIEKVPLRYVELNDADLEKLSEINDILQDLPDISKVFVNVK